MDIEEYQFKKYVCDALVDINRKVEQLQKDIVELKKNSVKQSQLEPVDRKLSAILSHLRIPFLG